MPQLCCNCGAPRGARRKRQKRDTHKKVGPKEKRTSGKEDICTSKNKNTHFFVFTWFQCTPLPVWISRIIAGVSDFFFEFPCRTSYSGPMALLMTSTIGSAFRISRFSTYNVRHFCAGPVVTGTPSMLTPKIRKESTVAFSNPSASLNLTKPENVGECERGRVKSV